MKSKSSIFAQNSLFMVASVSLNDVLRDEQQNEKIINFSSATLRFVSSVPNVVFSIILIPFLIILIPVLNVILASLIRKNKAVVKNIKQDMKEMDYESVKVIYDLLSGLNDKALSLNNEESFITKGLSNKLVKLLGLYKEIARNIEDVLFVDTTNQVALSTKEKADFDDLNDIWGDDDDGEYAKLTFNQLKGA